MEDITQILLDQLKAINEKLDSVTESIRKIEAKDVSQDKDIDELKRELKTIKEEQSVLKKEINDVTNKDDKNKANNWDTLINNIVKIVFTAASAWLLFKLGLK